MMERLALLGGSKAIQTPFRPYSSYGPEEVRAATAVIESGVLSKFLGAWDPDFYGGPKVQEFEKAWSEWFGVKHSISVNSNTSGLIAAIGAIGIEPGDEVIVSPWTMCATATAILVWNAIPVFADIENETFNLDPASIERRITSRTRAILVTDLFGHGAKLDAIMDIAKKHGLKVIEDAAQAPGAVYRGKNVGTWGDIGVFSFNYHKHIHTGEGGMCVTNDSTLAERLQLIRNHAEAVVGEKGVTDLSNMIGFNFRMGEIEAAMGIEQLKKLKGFVQARGRAGARLSEGLKGLKGIRTPEIKDGCNHVHYVYPMLLDTAVLGVPRSQIIEALKAEGVPMIAGGYAIVYRMPMYQKRIAHGKKGFPWTADFYKGDVSYSPGICPTAEELHDSTMLNLYTAAHHYTDGEVDQVISAFRKVWNCLDELKSAK